MVGPGDAVTARSTLRLIAILVACAAPSLLAQQIGPAFDELYHQVDHGSPYFPSVSPLLVYIGMPLVVFGSLVLVMLPGLLAAMALGASRTVEEWVVKGFAISLVGLSAVTQLVQALVGEPLTGYGFIATVAACSGLAGFALARRISAGAALVSPSAGSVLGLLVVPLLFLVALVPKFFWEAFNGDGAHAYEASRLLLVQATPFWPVDSASGGMYPGANTFLFTYPTAWFIRLFGSYEIAARLPLLAYLTVLYAAITAVATSGRPALGSAGRGLIWASVVSYALVMSFSGTYDPYCSDIALPATQDTLLMACFLGAVLAFVRRELIWSWLFLLLTLTGSPNGLPLAGAWLVAVLLTHRPAPWRRAGFWAAALGAAMLCVVVMPTLLGVLGQNPAGGEHTAGHLLKRFRFVMPFDFSRFAFLVVPGGIYTVLGVFAWRRMDAVTRALWLVTGFLFAMYYLMAFVSLHYFVPAMVLPIAAFWRHHRPGFWVRRGLGLAACSLAVAAALWLSLPRGTAIHVAAREVGELLEVRDQPDYASMENGYLHAPLLLTDLLFPMDLDLDVPERRYGGSPFAWNYYSNRAGAARTPNYLLTGADSPPPPNTVLIGSSEGVALYVRDAALLEQHRHMRPADSNGRALYAFSRDILFKRGQAADQYYLIDLREWRRWLFGED